MIRRRLDCYPTHFRKGRGNGWGTGKLAGPHGQALPGWERTGRIATVDFQKNCAMPCIPDVFERLKPDENGYEPCFVDKKDRLGGLDVRWRGNVDRNREQGTEGTRDREKSGARNEGLRGQGTAGAYWQVGELAVGELAGSAGLSAVPISWSVVPVFPVLQ